MNRQILFVKRPSGIPEENSFKLVTSPDAVPAMGEVVVHTKYISVDPYMRGRMNEGESYVPPFQLNQVLSGGVVGEVVESKSAAFIKGDMVVGSLGWQDYSIAGEKEIKKIDLHVAPASTALGVLGMTGLTAYFGFLDIGKPKSGETVVISGAAGAVGTIVGQIAKIKGCRVVGIAGSDKKTDYLINKVGFDAAIDYRTSPDLKKALKDACPKGVDVYFDNVGGRISDAVLWLINDFARIVLCGQISLYNESNVQTGPRIQPQLLTHHALMKGFIVSDYTTSFEEGLKQLGEWLKEKKLVYAENIVDGLENAPKAFIGLFSGENLGKQLVRLN